MKKSIILVALVLSWSFSAPILAEDNDQEDPAAQQQTLPKPRYMVPNKRLQRDQDVSRYLTTWGRDDERVVLEEGDADSEIIGFYLPQRTRSPQGAVLILPNDGEHSQWPVVIAPLREILPDSGWTTLTVNLPSIPPPTVSRLLDPQTKTEIKGENETELEESDTEVDENYNNEAPGKADLYREQMYARISAAVNYLQARGQLNLAIVAHGSSATWAALWMMESGLAVDKERGVGLVLVDAINDTYAPEKLNSSLAPIRIPVLDLITPYNRNANSTNQRRKGVMLSSKNLNYQQIVLNDVDMQARENGGVTRRVRGWLKKEMAGEERKVKQSTED